MSARSRSMGRPAISLRYVGRGAFLHQPGRPLAPETRRSYRQALAPASKRSYGTARNLPNPVSQGIQDPGAFTSAVAFAVSELDELREATHSMT